MPNIFNLSKQLNHGIVFGGSIGLIFYGLSYFISFCAGESWLTDQGIEYIHSIVMTGCGIVGVISSLNPSFKGTTALFIVALFAVLIIDSIYYLTIITEYPSYTGQFFFESLVEMYFGIVSIKLYEQSEEKMNEAIIPRLNVKEEQESGSFEH